MSQFTTHMGLVAWNDPSDPYSHVQLATNWALLDDHDHTPGNGVKIPQGGLADNSVGAPQIINGSITGIEIADGSIGSGKLDPAAWGSFIPLGIVYPYLRLDASITIPAGPGFLFEIPIGQTLTAANHDLGAFSITLPDLRDRFLFFSNLGAQSGALGGANTKNLQHSHVVNTHTHTVSAHTHVVDAHTHGVSDHAHLIGTDGSHRHFFAGGFTMHSRRTDFPSGTTIGAVGNTNQSAYVSGFNQAGNDAVADMDPTGSHNHGGATGGFNTGPSSVGTTASAPGTSASSPGTGPASDSGTGNALSSAFDIRPAYATLIPLVRVRNP